MTKQHCWNLYKLLKKVRAALTENHEQANRTIEALQNKQAVVFDKSQVTTLDLRRQRLRHNVVS